jgi:hypothetical protein
MAQNLAATLKFDLGRVKAGVSIRNLCAIVLKRLPSDAADPFYYIDIQLAFILHITAARTDRESNFCNPEIFFGRKLNFFKSVQKVGFDFKTCSPLMRHLNWDQNSSSEPSAPVTLRL